MTRGWRPDPTPPGLRHWPRIASQAWRTRRTALKLPEPEGPRSGELGAGPPLRLLIAGDSSAAGVGVDRQADGLSGQLTRPLAERFRVTWRLEASTGHTSADLLARLRALPADRWDAVVINIGVNDATRLVSLRRWTARQRAIHEVLRQRFGTRRIYRSGVPPLDTFPLLPHPLNQLLGARTARYDAALAALVAEAEDLVHIPFEQPLEAGLMAPDGFHPGPLLYAEWGQRIARHILADFDAGARRE